MLKLIFIIIYLIIGVVVADIYQDVVGIRITDKDSIGTKIGNAVGKLFLVMIWPFAIRTIIKFEDSEIDQDFDYHTGNHNTDSSQHRPYNDSDTVPDRKDEFFNGDRHYDKWFR